MGVNTTTRDIIKYSYNHEYVFLNVKPMSFFINVSEITELIAKLKIIYARPID